MDDREECLETARRLTRRYDFFHGVQQAGILAVGTCATATIVETGYYFASGQPNSSALNVATLGTLAVMAGARRLASVANFEAFNTRCRCIGDAGFDPEYEIETLDEPVIDPAPSP